jgi:hypothetical protein
MNRIYKLFTLLFLFAAMSLSLQAQFSTLWERSSAASSLPAWFGSTTERSFAYGNDHIYVVSRNGGTAVNILNATTGADLGTTLDVTGIAGGLFTLNDVEVSDDGVIFACNLTLDATTNAFKVYRWDTEASTPVAVVDFTSAAAARFGDKFTVAGSTADNSVEIWAVASGGTSVFRFTTADNGATFTSQQITLSDAAAGTSPAAWPVGNGNFYVNGNGINPKEYSSDGTFVSAVPGTVVPTGSNKTIYLEVGANKFILVYRYNTPDLHIGQLVDVTAGNDAAVLYGETVNLGLNGDTGNGDVDIKDNGDGSYTVFVLSANNGLGAYTTTDPVPVELTSLSASVAGNAVTLNWTTATETNNSGFEVQKADQNKNWERVGFVEGKGTTSETQSYSFVDNSVNSGVYYYRLLQVDFDGTTELSQEVEVNVNMPVEFELAQNYPNPFNPTTNIQFSLPEASSVNLVVYNLLGQEVATLANGFMEAGIHKVNFDAANLNTGLYVYKLEANDFVATKKMMLMK